MLITSRKDTVFQTTPYPFNREIQNISPVTAGTQLEIVDYKHNHLWSMTRIWIDEYQYYIYTEDWELPQRRINQAGIDIIMSYYYPEAYRRGDEYTLGYGTRERANRMILPEDKCTKEKALTWLKDDLEVVERGLEKCLRVPLNDNQWSALACIAQDITIPVFRNSKMLMYINDSLVQRMLAEFHAWVYRNGYTCPILTRRRMQEKNLFLSNNVQQLESIRLYSQ
jgi:lysozyme